MTDHPHFWNLVRLIRLNFEVSVFYWVSITDTVLQNLPALTAFCADTVAKMKTDWEIFAKMKTEHSQKVFMHPAARETTFRVVRVLIFYRENHQRAVLCACTLLAENYANRMEAEPIVFFVSPPAQRLLSFSPLPFCVSPQEEDQVIKT